MDTHDDQTVTPSFKRISDYLTLSGASFTKNMHNVYIDMMNSKLVINGEPFVVKDRA